MNEQYWFAPTTEDTSALSDYAIDAECSFDVRIVRCSFRAEDTGYSVYQVEPSAGKSFYVRGYFPVPLKLDAYYNIAGTVKEAKNGRVLQITDYKSNFPMDEDSVITILRTLPKLDTKAPAVYQALGPNALDLILNHPGKVMTLVHGASEALVFSWRDALKRLKDHDKALELLHQYQIPNKYAKSLLEKYPDIKDRLPQNPYLLIGEVPGFGFMKCDEIAMRSGYPNNGRERLEQAALYVLRHNERETGGCYMERNEFEAAVRSVIDNYKQKGKNKSLRVPDEDAKAAIAALRQMNRIVTEDDRIYSSFIYQSECAVAKQLLALKESEYGAFSDVETVLDAVCKEQGFSLEDKQREAVLTCCSGRGGAFVLAGRAGCGKTFTLNVIIRVLRRLYARQKLGFSARVMAPTGKAAQVAHAATGLPAYTIHKALGLVASGSLHSDTVLSDECIVVDEASMLGIGLSATLLTSIRPGAKVIIMGDFEQLESIEAGCVLKDVINSNRIPVITLNVVKRQAEGSGILYNANAILDGAAIKTKITNDAGLSQNAFIYKAVDAIACRNAMTNAVKSLLERGCAPNDIQVLCPQKKTPVGSDALNYAIQQVINPSPDAAFVFTRYIEWVTEDGKALVALNIKEGDRVIHTANDYEMKFFTYREGEGFVEDPTRVGIVNGEIGEVACIKKCTVSGVEHIRLYVCYGNSQYAMYEDVWDALSLAYAMTVHRAQGSQWPIVLAPVVMDNRNMLTKNLFYTLYTRAQTASFVFGDPKAIEHAVKTSKAVCRKTTLQHRLRGEL